MTQLVSIDLVVFDSQMRVLVGKRKNEPAKGTWFVPGSRLYKNERWKDAVKRVSREELGYEIDYSKTTSLGVYDHIYPTNFMNKCDESGEMISTHYVVIGLQIAVDPNKIDEKIFADQHSEICWMSIEELLIRDDVHQHTKNYFLSTT